LSRAIFFPAHVLSSASAKKAEVALDSMNAVRERSSWLSEETSTAEGVSAEGVAVSVAPPPCWTARTMTPMRRPSEVTLRTPTRDLRVEVEASSFWCGEHIVVD